MFGIHLQHVSYVGAIMSQLFYLPSYKHTFFSLSYKHTIESMAIKIS